MISVSQVSPTIATQIATSVTAGTESAKDTVTINGTTLGAGNGAPTTATVNWTLWSTPPVAGSCTGVWTNTLTQVATGSLTFTANGSGGAKTTSSTVSALDTCYSYSATLLADTSTPIGDWPQETSPVGQGVESSQAPPAPGVTTTASSATADPRTGVSDSVAVTGAGAGGQGTVDWSLVGPVTPGSGNPCATADWTGATTPFRRRQRDHRLHRRRQR